MIKLTNGHIVTVLNLHLSAFAPSHYTCWSNRRGLHNGFLRTMTMCAHDRATAFLFHVPSNLVFSTQHDVETLRSITTDSGRYIPCVVSHRCADDNQKLKSYKQASQDLAFRATIVNVPLHCTVHLCTATMLLAAAAYKETLSRCTAFESLTGWYSVTNCWCFVQAAGKVRYRLRHRHYPEILATGVRAEVPWTQGTGWRLERVR